ncbi:MAG: hypothetical protein HY868_22195 [Chloroflexi bacterium]|nr:hypothetical protein [Chloroflexota bacterium]
MLHIKTKLFFFVLIVSFLLLAWLGVAPPVVPIAQAQSSTLYTQFTAQNLDPSTVMNVRVKYSDANGSPVLTTTHTVNPYRSITINQPSQVGLATTFNGSAVFDADRPFGLVVNEYNGTVGALGKNFRTESYIGASTPVTETVLTQLLKNVYDPGNAITYNSSLKIQNTNTGQFATVTIKYKQSYGEEYTHSGIVISPGGWYAIDLPNDSALTNVSVFYGTARITSTQPIVVIAYHSTAISLANYVGLSAANASTTLYFPQLIKNIYDSGANFTWNNGVSVMSFDGTPANVTMTYKSSDGAFTVSESQVAAPIGLFDLRYSSALAGVSSFYGSGVITADKPVVATINMVSNTDTTRGTRAATYRAFSSAMGGTRVFLPSLWKNATDPATGVSWGTGVVGQLIGNSATTVTLTYYLTNGMTASQSATISPSVPMFTFDQRYFAGIPDGTIASGVLTTNPPQSIIAAVSFATASTTYGDACMYYEGIGQ